MGASACCTPTRGARSPAPPSSRWSSKHGIRLSRDGKGAWRDSLFVERLWKSVEYEEVYLHAYDSVAAAHQRRARYFTCYTSGQPHSALDGRTPDTVYFGGPLQQKAA